MTTADNPENTVPTSPDTSITTDGDTPAQPATTQVRQSRPSDTIERALPFTGRIAVGKPLEAYWHESARLGMRTGLTGLHYDAPIG